MRDGLRRRVHPGAFVDTTRVHEQKRAALACHASQRQWLDAQQGMDNYLRTMDEFSRDAGQAVAQVPARRRLAAPFALGFLRRGRGSAARARSAASTSSTPRTSGHSTPGAVHLRLNSNHHASQTQLDRARLVGLHDARRRSDRRGRPADAATISRASRVPASRVVLYDTLEEFYLAEALEYIDAWRQSTDDNPVGICGPIGPTEQLPLVARIVNALGSTSARHISGAWTNGSMPRPAGKCR